MAEPWHESRREHEPAETTVDITETTRVLITGANGGIGAAIARAFARRGARLLVTGRRPDALEALCAELGAEALSADLVNEADVERLCQASLDCDVVVHNAALPASGPLGDFTPDEIDRALAVNLRAPIHIARAAGAAMAERSRGHIVFISSIAGKVASGHTSLYSATKFGLRGFSLGLREDLRASGVGVTTVFPGFIREAGMFAMTGVKLPTGVGTRSPEDVAAAVLHAVLRNPAEIDVAAFEQRLGGWIGHFAPDFVARIQRMSGGEAIWTKISAGQRNKR